MPKRGQPSLLGEKLGPYYIEDRLGQGGMGAVYLARDVALERKVALKVLLSRYADDEEFVARFQREARASAKLNHPNIVQIYTVDVASDPPYMAMEYIEGENLESFIRSKQRLEWQQALAFVGQVASALACAHEAGIIHRDIKPANVLVDPSGRARVTDFGIAKIVGSQTQLTGTQHTVGSPSYMSPEQCGVGEIVPASDLFSLGIMLFEMVTGTVPFKGESSVVIMRKIADEDVPALSSLVEGIPPAVEQLLRALTARDVSLRYQSAQQVLEDLRALQTGNTMDHLQALALQKAAQAPASATAGELTRSATGKENLLNDSLVDDLLDVRTTRVKPEPVRTSLDIPWAGIVIMGLVIVLGVLAMLYYKGWEASRRQNPTPPSPTSEDLELHPPPEGNRPPRGFHPQPRDGFRPPPPEGHRPPPRDGRRPPPPGGNQLPQ